MTAIVRKIAGHIGAEITVPGTKDNPSRAIAGDSAAYAVPA
jgi:hypothetical protein